jgi:hypothetical protein
MEVAIATEKSGRNDSAEAVLPAATPEDVIRRPVTGAPILRGDTAKAKKIVDACGGSVEGLNTCIRKTAFYAEWNARFGEPPAQFEADDDAAFAATSRDNPVIAHFTPSLSRLRWAEAYSETRSMLLQAAVGVQRDGRRAVARYVDPSTSAQFTYSPQDRGFRLESQLKENGQPLSVMVRGKVGR